MRASPCPQGASTPEAEAFKQSTRVQYNEFPGRSVGNPCRRTGLAQGRALSWPCPGFQKCALASVSLSTSIYWTSTAKFLPSWNLCLGFSFSKWISNLLFCTRSTISLGWGLCLSLSQTFEKLEFYPWNSSPIMGSASLVVSTRICLSSPSWPVAGNSDIIFCPLCLSVLINELQAISVSLSKKYCKD